MVKATLFSCIVSFMLMLPGCGGGTSNAVPIQMNTAIVLSATLVQGQTSPPIKIIDVTFVLPQSATPILSPDGKLQIGETGLKNLNPKGNIPTGSYNPTTREVRFSLLPNDIATTDLGTGDIARLTCNISSGAQLLAEEIHPVYGVFGQGSVEIIGKITPSVRIETYQKP